MARDNCAEITPSRDAKGRFMLIIESGKGYPHWVRVTLTYPKLFEDQDPIVKGHSHSRRRTVLVRTYTKNVTGLKGFAMANSIMPTCLRLEKARKLALLGPPV